VTVLVPREPSIGAAVDCWTRMATGLAGA